LAELVGIERFGVIGHADESAAVILVDAAQLGEREFAVRVGAVNVQRAF